MKKIFIGIVSIFSFVFMFLVNTNGISAQDKVINYETYILKYNYSVNYDNGDVWTYNNETYVLDVPNDLEQIEYVTYFFNVKNVGSEKLVYPFGTYSISDNVASTTKIRFEDDVSVNGITYFAVRNYDINTIEEFMSSMISIPFYESMVECLNEYLNASLEFAYIDSGGATISGYDDIYGYDGFKYTYYAKGSNTTTYAVYSTNELPALYSHNEYIFENVSLTRLSDLYTVTDLELKYAEGYNEGKADGIESVDITRDNQEAIDEYLVQNDLYTNEEFVEYGELKHQEGYDKGKIDGANSVDITIDNQEIYNNGYQDGINSVDLIGEYTKGYNNGYIKGKEVGIEEGKASIDVNAIRQEAYENGFNEGVISVDITQDNQAIYEEAYKEGMDDGLIIGFENGKKSIDVSAIEQEAYDKGYQNGYNVGFAEGEYSVDITKDNDTAIHLYITQNKYHTDHEFNLNFDLGYSSGKNDGINFVYENMDNDTVIKKYVKDYIYLNKYYTSTEYINNYDSGYQSGFKDGYDSGFVAGKEVIYKTIESDPIIKEYYKEKLINGTKITFVQEGDEEVKVIKNYDINETDTGDFRIIIHNGQDTYTVETVENVIPGENNTTEIVKESDNSDLIDFLSKFGIVLLVFIGTVGVIWLFKAITNISFKGRGNNREKSFAV